MEELEKKLDVLKKQNEKLENDLKDIERTSNFLSFVEELKKEVL